MVESQFQKKVKDELRGLFPGCIILKNDPDCIQGIPDLTILYNDRWATLEVKKSKTASHQPNQDYYVELMNSMSYSAFIFPENKEEVYGQLQRVFGSKRKARGV